MHVAGIYNSAISAAAAIDSNAEVFQRDVSGRTPLHMAASNDAVETLTHMVAHAKRGLLDEVIYRERERARGRETCVRARDAVKTRKLPARLGLDLNPKTKPLNPKP